MWKIFDAMLVVLACEKGGIGYGCKKAGVENIYTRVGKACAISWGSSPRGLTFWSHHASQVEKTILKKRRRDVGWYNRQWSSPGEHSERKNSTMVRF